MNELIKVNYDKEQPTVSARDLHEALGIKERFSLWFSRYDKYFENGADFTRVGKPTVVNNGAERVFEDFCMTTDMAKHISMMTKTEKGKQMRQYFIDLEKAWNTPEQIMARALKMADKTIEKLKTDNKALEQKIEHDKPKTIFADAVSTSHTSILIGDLAKLICQNGVHIGQKRLFEWMRQNNFLIKSGSSRNMPMQRYVEQGLFKIKESSYVDGNGCNVTTKTTVVTGKGQIYFVNRFLKERTGKRC